MAIGDDALAYGYSVVDDGDLAKLGFQEINRTRDYLAQLATTIPSGKAGYRTASGISSGTTDPSGGSDGDVYFKTP